MLQIHVIWFSMFVFIAAKAGSGLLTPTSDRLSAVVVGDRVSFGCRADHPTREISWVYYRPGSRAEHTIHTGRRMNPMYAAQFEVDRPTYVSELTTRSVTLEESGLYICSETITAVTRLDFQLVVLESAPNCHLNVTRRRLSSVPGETDDQLQVTCSVPYSGNVVPSFHCDPDIPGEQVLSGVDASTHIVSYSKRVNSSLVDVTTRFTCHAMLNATMRDGRTATNYFYNWTSADILRSTVPATNSSGPSATAAVGGNIAYSSGEANQARKEAHIDSLLLIVIVPTSLVVLIVLVIVGACVIVTCRRRRSASAVHTEPVIYDDACTATRDADLPSGMTHVETSSVPPDVTTWSRRAGALDALTSQRHRPHSNGSNSSNSYVSDHNYSEIRDVDGDNNHEACDVKSAEGCSAGIYMELQGDDVDRQRPAVPSVYDQISTATTLPSRLPRGLKATGKQAAGNDINRSTSEKQKRIRQPSATQH